MKFKNLFVPFAACVLLLAVSAQAQFDTFSVPRTIVITPPTILTADDHPRTSLPFDTHGFQGVAKIDFTCMTNTVGGTLTVCLNESSTGTNAWTPLTNCVAYATSVSVENTFDPLLTTTNIFLLPGVLTTPTAATAGFANIYLKPAQFTNTVSALSLTPNAVYEIGYQISNAKRFLQAVYTTGGTVTNITVSAVLTARASQNN